MLEQCALRVSYANDFEGRCMQNEYYRIGNAQQAPSEALMSPGHLLLRHRWLVCVDAVVCEAIL